MKNPEEKTTENQSTGENEENPKCDKTNPTDPHYGEAGNYNEKCVWIPDLGK